MILYWIGLDTKLYQLVLRIIPTCTPLTVTIMLLESFDNLPRLVIRNGHFIDVFVYPS